MADVLEELRRVVDRLGGADPSALADDELHALVVGLQQERARLGWRILHEEGQAREPPLGSPAL